MFQNLQQRNQTNTKIRTKSYKAKNKQAISSKLHKNYLPLITTLQWKIKLEVKPYGPSIPDLRPPTEEGTHSHPNHNLDLISMNSKNNTLIPLIYPKPISNPKNNTLIHIFHVC